MPLVTFQPSDDHGEIVVDRPLQNLFSGDLLTDSRRAVDDAASCDVRAALVRAEGDDSSAGVDIDVFIAKASSSRPAFALSLANGPTLAHTATKRVLHAWRPGGVAAAERVTLAEEPAVMVSHDLQERDRTSAARRSGPRQLHRALTDWHLALGRTSKPGVAADAEIVKLHARNPPWRRQ